MLDFFPSRTVALKIGPLAVHWYGVMYLLAFLLGWKILPKLQRLRGLELTEDQIASFVLYGVLGTIIGGRLGYALLYNFSFSLQHPLTILAIWEGGMASHGGFLGVIIAGFLFCKKFKVDFWRLADIVVVPVAIGLALGRVGNFINEELYGTVTSLPWGMQFADAEGLRHPTQIYAVLKNLLIAGICYLHLRRTCNLQRATCNGTTFALFLILYAILRFLVEFVRVQTVPKIWMGFFWISYGQLLTIPLFIAGIAVLFLRRGSSEARLR